MDNHIGIQALNGIIFPQAQKTNTRDLEATSHYLVNCYKVLLLDLKHVLYDM